MDQEETDWLCFGCVGDYYLQQEIKAKGKRNRCKFCKKTRRCYSVSQVGDRVHLLFGSRCTREVDEDRADTPLFWIATFLGNDEDEVAKAVQEYLSDTYDSYEEVSSQYGDDAFYRSERLYEGIYAKKWEQLRKSLRHESRYFNPTAKEILKGIFDGLNFDLGDNPKAHLPSYMQDRPIITLVGPGHRHTILYRSREARNPQQAKELLEAPSERLGPPPPLFARGGRMNPSGVSLFYGALEPETCISEIRAPVGTYVVTGEFEVLRPLRLLDFKKLREATERIPHFHPQYDEKKDRDAFLEEFCFEIATPVHPQDEAFGYLPTQAVAEYLAQRADLKLDGLLFPSTQTGSKGTNVVLFRPASVVAHDDQRFTTSTIVFGHEFPASFEITTKPIEPATPAKDDIPAGLLDNDFLEEVAPLPPPPEPTLRLNLQTIKVVRIKSSEYEHEDSSLYRFKHTDERRDDF